MNVFDYYVRLVVSARKWIFGVFLLFLVSVFLGFLYFYQNQGLIEVILEQYKSIIPPGIVSDRLLVGAIFKQNLTAAMLALFFGAVFGLIPFAVVALNGFIVGYITHFVFTVSEDAFFPTLIGFMVSFLPHAVFELPAIFFAAALGLWLGLSGFFKKQGRGEESPGFWQRLITCIFAVPLIAIVLLLAAYVEVYVSMGLGARG